MSKPTLELPILPPAKFVACGEYRLAYFVTGDENGRPLVLCHGLAANGLQFVEDAAYFATKGFRVLVPDLRGHGRSTCPKNRKDEDFSIGRLASDLLAMLDAEGITSTDWVGNSLGGILALSLMDTDRARLKRVITFGTAYSLNVSQMVTPLLQTGYRVLGTEILARIGAPATCRGKRGQAIIYEMLRKMDINAVLRVTEHVREYDMIANGLAFDGPLLMIRGERDKAVNSALKPTLTAMSPASHFHLIDLEDAGHCANLDRPDAVRGIISGFLDEAAS